MHVKIMVVMLVPMHVLGAVIVAMNMRMSMMCVAVVVPMSLTPTLPRDPCTEGDERNRGYERYFVGITIGSE